MDWSKAHRLKPLEWTRDGECIICTSHPLDWEGYPQMTRSKHRMRVARFVLFRRYGKQPSSVVSRHTCDRRDCINPDHIIPGSTADNSRDMVARGRSADKRGEKNGNVRLREEQVQLIISLIREERLSRSEIAKRFNVTPNLISRIKHFKAWRHLARQEFLEAKEVGIA